MKVNAIFDNDIHMAPQRLQHSTLNTGDLQVSLRAEYSGDAIEILRPVVAACGSIPVAPGIRLTVAHADGGASFTVWQKKLPLLTCGVAWTADGEQEIRPQLAEIHQKLFGRTMVPARKPAQMPWLAVAFWPSILLVPRKDIAMFAALERCFAWTLLEPNENGLATSCTSWVHHTNPHTQTRREPEAMINSLNGGLNAACTKGAVLQAFFGAHSPTSLRQNRPSGILVKKRRPLRENVRSGVFSQFSQFGKHPLPARVAGCGARSRQDLDNTAHAARSSFAWFLSHLYFTRASDIRANHASSRHRRSIYTAA